MISPSLSRVQRNNGKGGYRDISGSFTGCRCFTLRAGKRLCLSAKYPAKTLITYLVYHEPENLWNQASFYAEMKKKRRKNTKLNFLWKQNLVWARYPCLARQFCMKSALVHLSQKSQVLCAHILTQVQSSTQFRLLMFTGLSKNVLINVPLFILSSHAKLINSNSQVYES